MTFEEKDTAILKFERRLRAFIENYIDDGHTQQEEDPIYGDGYCCTDCRRAFLLTKGGRIAEFSI